MPRRAETITKISSKINGPNCSPLERGWFDDEEIYIMPKSLKTRCEEKSILEKEANLKNNILVRELATELMSYSNKQTKIGKLITQ